MGQGGRLETAELLNRGRRRRFNSRGQAANDRRRNAVWNSVQVRNGEKCTRTEESKCIVGALTSCFDSQNCEDQDLSVSAAEL